MQRWDIINHFIKKNGYKSYLEIGYYKGWSFDKVGHEMMDKLAIDPNPCADVWQEKWEYGSYHDMSEWKDGGRHCIMKITSDDFFAKLPESRKYDIIFIDGLHEADQVTKDIENSLKHLSEGGMIIIHDCNPPQYEHTTIGIDGCWTGDTYRAWAQFLQCYSLPVTLNESATGRKSEHKYNVYTLDTDWGIGIIDTSSKGNWCSDSSINLAKLTNKEIWELFDLDRKAYINLISLEEFKQQEQYEPVA